MLSTLLLMVLLLPLPTMAQDSLPEVLARIAVNGQPTRHFHYQETRELQLLAAPWQADGDLFLGPRQMVIAQRSPSPTLTVIGADRMLHNDPAQDIHHNLVLDQPWAVPGMEPLMQLMYGAAGSDELRQQYQLSFDSDAQRWTLSLKPRWPGTLAVALMQVAGANGHGPDQMLLQSDDGDRRDWRLTPVSEGAAAERELSAALSSLNSAAAQ